MTTKAEVHHPKCIYLRDPISLECNCGSRKNQAAVDLGRRGGQKTAERGADYYSRIGKQGAAKRWQDYDHGHIVGCECERCKTMRKLRDEKAA